MSKFPNEEQLTAYVLGELPEAERVRVEGAIAKDPVVAAEVERLRKTAGYLRANLEKHSDYRLSPDRRAALDAALRRRAQAGGGMPEWLRSLFRPYVLGPVAAAALILIVVWQGGVPKATTPIAEKAQDLQVYSEPPPAPLREAAPAEAPAAQSPAPVAQTPPPAASKVVVASPRSADESARQGVIASAPEEMPLAAADEAAGGVASREEAGRNTGELRLPASPAESAAAPESKLAAAPPAAVRPAAPALPMVRAGAYAIEVRMPPAAGTAADAQRLARQIAERVTARPAKSKNGDATAAKSDRRKDERRQGFQVLEQETGGELCEISITVVDAAAGEPGKILRREVPCNLDALVSAFEELAKRR